MGMVRCKMLSKFKNGELISKQDYSDYSFHLRPKRQFIMFEGKDKKISGVPSLDATPYDYGKDGSGKHKGHKIIEIYDHDTFINQSFLVPSKYDETFFQIESINGTRLLEIVMKYLLSAGDNKNIYQGESL